VQIVDDDVVVVSVPQKSKKKQIPFLKWGIAAILCLFIMIAACFVLLGSDEKNNNEVGDIEHMLNKPIKPSLKKKVTIDTTHSNSQIINRNDSARNK
jgi:3-deoxy-D-arabino-heptulosonate 7-phosphate (DAHP) synthase